MEFIYCSFMSLLRCCTSNPDCGIDDTVENNFQFLVYMVMKRKVANPWQ